MYASPGSTGQAVSLGAIRNDYSPQGRPCVGLYCAGQPANNAWSEVIYGNPDLDGISRQIRVVPDQWYEASAYVSTIGCAAYLTAAFFDNNGAYITEVSSPPIATNYSHWNSQPQWDAAGRAWRIFKTPANCVWADVRVRATSFTAAGSYAFISGLMLAPCRANQTEPSPFVEGGVTTIEGGRIRALSIDTGQIKANAITSGKILAGEVKAVNIGTGAITAEKVFAGAITAEKLTLSDISNMVLNGEFKDGKFEGWYSVNGAISVGPPGDPGGQWRLFSMARDVAYSNVISVTPDDEIYLSAMVYNVHGVSAGLLAILSDQGGGAAQYPSITSAHTDGWRRVEGRIKIPAGIQQMQILIWANKNSGDPETGIYWGKIQVRRAASAQMIVDGAITADKVRANSITANKLAVASSNMAFNPRFEMGMRGFTHQQGWTGHSGMNLDAVGNWAPAGFRPITSNAANTSAGGLGGSYTDFTSQMVDTAGNIQNYPVTAGAWIEVSACVSAHRCNAHLYIAWCNSAGAVITYSKSNEIINNTPSGETSYRDFPKCFVAAQAPAGAAQFFVILRAAAPYGDAPYIFWSALMIGPCVPNQTYPSDYADPGLTVIGGGRIITGSIAADRIVGKSITAAQIEGLSITGNEIAANSITTNKLTIAARQIQTAGFNFRYNRTVNQIQWDTGYIYYTHENGTTVGVTIAAGAHINDGWGSLNWPKGQDWVHWSNDINYASNTNQDWLCLLCWDGGGLDIKHGNTIIDGGRVVANTIHGDKITAGTISADRIELNSLTASQIASGAISTDELAAGAVTANKIGVGLSTGNRFFNSDFSQNIIGWQANWHSDGVVPYVNIATDFSPSPGVYSALVHRPDAPGNRVVADYVLRRRVGDAWSNQYPAAEGQRFEFTAYVSGHRANCAIALQFVNGNGHEIGIFWSNELPPYYNNGPLNGWPRLGVFGTAPPGTYGVIPICRTIFTGDAQPYQFWTCLYLGLATTHQSEFSPYAPSSMTVIDGGYIATGSLHANKITAGTITGDRILGREITAGHIKTNQIWSEHIAGEQITGGHIVGGTITGTHIAAGSIDANKLTVRTRGISVIACDIQVRASDGYISWGSGYVSYIDNNGNRQDQPINAAGRVASGWTMIGWYIGWDNFAMYDNTNGSWAAGMADPNFVPLAFYTGGSGLVAYYGNTIIDGGRIVTGSIQAGQIAAGAINADKIGSDQIQARHIAVGQVTADKIGTGTLTAGAVYIGNHRFVLEAYNTTANRRMYIRDDNDQLRAMIGYIGDQVGGTDRAQPYGLCMWDQWGTLIANGGGYHGGAIWARSIGAHSIVANTITANEITGDRLIVAEAQIGELVVGNTRLANNSVSQTVAAGSSGQSAGVTIATRGTGKVQIRAGRHGSPGFQQSALVNTGNLRVYRDGGELFGIPANFMYRHEPSVNASYKFPLGHVLLLTDEVGAGVHNYQVVDDNNIGLGGVFIEVTELSK